MTTLIAKTILTAVLASPAFCPAGEAENVDAFEARDARAALQMQQQQVRAELHSRMAEQFPARDGGTVAAATAGPGGAARHLPHNLGGSATVAGIR